MDAFQILQGADKYFLPRISMYFDDIVGSDNCDFTGERLAIADFNSRSANDKISPEYGAQLQEFAETWNHQIFALHKFAHPDYCEWVWKKIGPPAPGENWEDWPKRINHNRS